MDWIAFAFAKRHHLVDSCGMNCVMVLGAIIGLVNFNRPGYWWMLGIYAWLWIGLNVLCFVRNYQLHVRESKNDPNPGVFYDRQLAFKLHAAHLAVRSVIYTLWVFDVAAAIFLVVILFYPPPVNEIQLSAAAAAFGFVILIGNFILTRSQYNYHLNRLRHEYDLHMAGYGGIHHV